MEKKTAHEPVYRVSGKVIYKGSPVVGADVTFVSEAKNRSAFARTDEQGHFKLTTFSPNDGAVAGKQIVLVRKVQSGDAAKEPEVSDPAYDPFKVAGNAPATPPKNEIPQKYADPKTSDLIAVVNEGDNPEMTLELTD